MTGRAVSMDLAKRARRWLRRWLIRLDPRPKILFITDWYGWVDAPLFERVRSLKGVGHRVRRVSRGEILSYESPSSTAVLETELTADNYRSVVHAGLNLWEVAKSSIADRLLHPVPVFPRDGEVILEVYEETRRILDAFDRYLRWHRPRVLVVTQGLQYDQRAAVEVGRRLGIRTVAIENSFLRDFFFMDDSSGAITNRHWLARGAWDTIRARTLTAEQREQVRTGILGSSTTVRHPDAQDDEQLRAQLGIPPGRRIALLLGQVAVDAAVVMDSNLFEDQFEFMMRACRIFEAHSETHHLVIRLHPKEATGMSHDGTREFGNMTWRRIRDAGLDGLPHVSVVHSLQANTYQLMEMADFGLTLTSQTGLEMLARYRPVIVAGDAFFSRKGFTVDVVHPDDLSPAISRTISSPTMPEVQRHAVDNFLHFALFEYMYPKSLAGTDGRLRSLFR